jgi:hypothetical protein
MNFLNIVLLKHRNRTADAHARDPLEHAAHRLKKNIFHVSGNLVVTAHRLRAPLNARLLWQQDVFVSGSVRNSRRRIFCLHGLY